MIAIAFVCTGKGTHRRKRLYCADADPRSWHPHPYLKGFVFGRGTTEDNRKAGRIQRGPRYRLCCPSCNPRGRIVRADTLQTLLSGLAERGVSEVDLSALPF